MSQPSLFSANASQALPLPERLRPATLHDVVGHEALLGQQLLNKALVSCIFWGPPGCGKTTLARLLATQHSAHFVELSATSTGLKELREVIDQAKQTLQLYGQKTALFIDEIHRYSKTQQDALLPAVERGMVILLGATTENPSFQVVPALLSRLLVFRLAALENTDVIQIIQRGVVALGCKALDPELLQFIARYANGDARSALVLLETAVALSGNAPLTLALLETLAQQNRVVYEGTGEGHYDCASAYQKSLRGSDADAAIYWLAKMLAGGEDPRFPARRLLVTASEDVSLADPMALVVASHAYSAVERLGMPECRIALAQATIYVARAPKNNHAIVAIDAAMQDILHHGKNYPVPIHLKDSHYAGAKQYGHGHGYVYTHEHPNQLQQFLPQELQGQQYVARS